MNETNNFNEQNAVNETCNNAPVTANTGGNANNYNNSINNNTSNGKAIASLVLGIVGCICSFTIVGGIVLGIIGLVLGLNANKVGKSTMATAGVILSIIALAISAVILLFFMVIGMAFLAFV